MQLKGYDITLKRISESDIELVRGWRNSSVVNQFMEYRNQISPQDQIMWFNKVNNIYNNYYLIINKNTPVGLIYGSEIDWENKITGNGGIFLCDEKYFLTDIPIRAMFLINDVAYFLGLKTTYIKVLKENSRAIFFNKKIGYKLLPYQDKINNQKYILEIENYLDNTKKFKKIMGYNDNIILLIEFNNPMDIADLNFIEQLNLNKNLTIPGVTLKIVSK